MAAFLHNALIYNKNTYETVYRTSTDINYTNKLVYQQRQSLFDVIVVWDFLVLGVSIEQLPL